MMKTLIAALGLSLIPCVATGWAALDQHDESKASASKPEDAAVNAQIPFYPVEKCVVSGEPLIPGDINDVMHEGRLVRLCCGMCQRQLDKDPAAVIAKLDAAAVRAQKPYYPLADCLISDEKLGSMGDPIEVIHEGRLARLCCKGCVKSFHKDPAKYFATIDRAMIADQKEHYEATTCPVSGEPLGDGAYDHLYGYRLVRTCCKKCAAEVDKAPAKYVAKVAVSRGAHDADGHGHGHGHGDGHDH